jgi:hypothetical protein
MMQSWVFNESTPSSPGTVASSQAVTGTIDPNIAAGVAGWLDDYESISVVAELTGKAADGSAVGGTVGVSVQTSPDGGQTWFEAIRFATVSSGAALAYQKSNVSLWSGASAPVAVAKGTSSPVLTAGAGVSGGFGGLLRLLLTSGTGTTKSAAVVVRVAAQRRRLREAGGR